MAFLRKARDPRDAVVFAANFSAISRPQHRIGVPYPVSYTELFDSNAGRYGGFGANPASPLVVQAEEILCHGREFSIRLTLPGTVSGDPEAGPVDTRGSPDQSYAIALLKSSGEPECGSGRSHP